jgi:hypothetical protein
MRPEEKVVGGAMFWDSPPMWVPDGEKGGVKGQREPTSAMVFVTRACVVKNSAGVVTAEVECHQFPVYRQLGLRSSVWRGFC